ncbi:VanZ family protein [Bacillus atrophaeus]|uniref:VanZ family protein n=1 Tax=Bacillus atrophaeus TaxID=1452 RepID=UPI002E1D2968|nr:VanZ family protein [Bacillus atrophaeus]MED4814254.1 VanZ family protein [Bacillus atrophaeus]MED4826252.1 VanZ family protein [Bacillus atrophaeus]MED4844912.1 VanZ family protein [Bacillus atrophaeus]
MGDILIFTWLQLIPLLIIYSAVMFLRYRKRKTSFIQQIVYLSFFIYSVLVISKTFLPIPISKRYIQIIIESNTAQKNNFIPFSDIYKLLMVNPNHLLDVILKQIGGNILLLLPLGFYAPILWKRFNKVKSVLALGFLVSSGIELTQLITSTILGVTYRSFVVDDIILNTIGVLTGYCLFKIISPLLINIIKSIDTQNNKNLKLLNLWRD